MKNLKRIALALSILIALLCVTGCADYQNPDIKGHTTIEGHDYIVLKVNGNYGQSFIHNPDCLIEDLKK